MLEASKRKWCLIELVLTIWPSLASFLMSLMTFFSCCSIFIRSRSRSRMALFSARWFLRSISSGVIRCPNSHSIVIQYAYCWKDNEWLHECVDHVPFYLSKTTINGFSLNTSTKQVYGCASYILIITCWSASLLYTGSEYVVISNH